MDYYKFTEFRQSKFLTDFDIISNDGTTFSVHKVILSAQSVYFETLFSNQSFIENKRNSVILPYDAKVSKKTQADPLDS